MRCANVLQSIAFHAESISLRDRAAKFKGLASTPMSAVGLPVVTRGARHRTIGRRIGEAVERVANADNLPVKDRGVAHLVLEGCDLFGGRQRIVGAGAKMRILMAC